MSVMKAISNFFSTLFRTSQAEKELRAQFESAIESKKKRASNLALAKVALEKAQQNIHDRVDQIEGNVKRESIPNG